MGEIIDFKTTQKRCISFIKAQPPTNLSSIRHIAILSKSSIFWGGLTPMPDYERQ
jgi:hypothetical protein